MKVTLDLSQVITIGVAVLAGALSFYVSTQKKISSMEERVQFLKEQNQTILAHLHKLIKAVARLGGKIEDEP